MDKKLDVPKQQELNRRLLRFSEYMSINGGIKDHMQSILIILSFFVFMFYGLFIALTPLSVVLFAIGIFVILCIAIPHIERSFIKEANKWAQQENGTNDKK